MRNQPCPTGCTCGKHTPRRVAGNDDEPYEMHVYAMPHGRFVPIFAGNGYKAGIAKSRG